jgi:hypothetical protein
MRYNWLGIAISVLVTVSIGIYGWPVFRGDLGLLYKKENQITAYQINPRIQEINLKYGKSKGRSIIIPSSHADELNIEHYQSSLNSLRYGGALPLSDLVKTNLIQAFNRKDIQFYNYINLAGIEYIILLKKYDVQQRQFSLFSSAIPFEEALVFLRAGHLVQYEETPEYIVLRNKKFVPLLYSAQHIAITKDDISLNTVSAFNQPGREFLQSLREESSAAMAHYQAVDQTFITLNPNITGSVVLRNNQLIKISLFKEKREDKAWLIVNKLDPFDGIDANSISLEIGDWLENSHYYVSINQDKIVLKPEPTELTVRAGEHSMIVGELLPVAMDKIDSTFEDISFPLRYGSAIKSKPTNTVYAFYDAPGHNSLHAVTVAAKNNQAYLNIPLPVPDIKSTYFLTFDYTNLEGNSPSYAIWQNGNNISFPRGKLGSLNRWDTTTLFFTPESGATSVNFYFYSYSQDESEAVNTLDNVYLYQAQPGATIPLTISPYRQLYDAKLSQVTLNPDSGKNLIEQNASFEHPDLWQDRGDASIAEPGPALISYSQSPDAAVGQYSLQIESRGHTGYIQQKVADFDPHVPYKISFYYKNKKGMPPSYAIWQGGAHISSPYAVLKPVKSWTYFEHIFIPQANATGLTVYLYANSKNQHTVNQYDEVRVEKLSLFEQVFVTSAQNNRINNLTIETYKRVNPAKIILTVSGTSGVLVFNESFHQGWRAFIMEENTHKNQIWDYLPFMPRGKQINEANHLVINNFSNGWIINNPGESNRMHIVVEYWPQRYFYLSLVVSAITLGSCLGYIGYQRYRQRHLNTNTQDIPS